MRKGILMVSKNIFQGYAYKVVSVVRSSPGCKTLNICIGTRFPDIWYFDELCHIF